jgi:hypothetical protein
VGKIKEKRKGKQIKRKEKGKLGNKRKYIIYF